MKKMMMIGAVVVGLIAHAKPTVTGVTAQQRYPWNGLVDIVVTLEGVSAEDIPLTECSFVATNSATGAAIPVTSITQKGDDTGSGTTWTRRFVWDAANDIGEVKIDDVALTVDAKVVREVQLWKNGPYWAKCNVGATKPEEYGYYFWWGDTVGYKRNAADNGWISVKDGSSFSFTEGNCPTMYKSFSQLRSAGYIDSTGNLVAAHDAATAHLGAPWRMPTDAEFAALINNCDTTWTTRGGVSGRLVTGRGAYASKSIFLPAAGYGNISYLHYTGSCGYYWSSPPYSDYSDYAWHLRFHSSYFDRLIDTRCYGQSVRPLRGFANGATSNVQSGVGVTTHLKLDCRTGVRACLAEGETIVYSTEWDNEVKVRGEGEGGDADAVAVVSVNGVVISEKSGSGTVMWTPVIGSSNELTHVVMKGGVPVGETLTACFNGTGPYTEVVEGVEWSYMVRDGKAIVGTPDEATAVPKSTKGSIAVPAKLGGFVVAGVGAYAFNDCAELEEVVLHSNIVMIEEHAFANCTGLEAMYLPEGLERIDDFAFLNCTWMQDVSMPTTLRKIGNGAFANCAMLPRLVCNEGLADIGSCAFSNCWRMLSVSAPASVTNVGEVAFKDCRGVMGVVFPTHIRSFKDIFPDAYGQLADATIPEGEFEVCKACFQDCAALTEIDIPNGVTNLGAQAFMSCTNLENVRLPNDLECIGDQAFYECTSLREIALPDTGTLKTIGAGAFRYDKGLTSIKIPDSVENVMDYAFCDCTGLQNADFGSVKTVGWYAFANCGLKDVAFKDGLEHLGERAFQNCKGIGDVQLPVSLQTAGASVFASCSAVTNVTMPSGVTTVPTLFPNAYTKIPRLTITPGSENVYDGFCSGCSALVHVSIPSSVQSVGARAFQNCQALTEIGLPEGVTSVGAYAFSGCGNLTRLALPKNLETIGDYAFQNCVKVTSLTMPERVSYLGNGIVNGCSALNAIYYLGDAPSYASGVYAGTPSGLTSYVVFGSRGWDGVPTSKALPEHWPTTNSRAITYWEPNRFVIEFDANGGVLEGTNRIEQITGTTYVLPEKDPTYAGKVFKGWWTEPVHGARVTSDMEATVTQDMMLYAHWEAKTYVVHFNANGGTGEMADIVLTMGVESTPPLNQFARVDYGFNGWARNYYLEPEFDDGATVKDLTDKDEITLYATWKEKKWGVAEYFKAPGRYFGDGGDAKWVTDDLVTSGEFGSVRSGDIGLDSTSELWTVVQGTGKVSFKWKVSCEEEYKGKRYDYIAFYVDGDEKGYLAGEKDWQEFSVTITGAGEHTLTWKYVKDDYDDPEATCADCAWLDVFKWSPTPYTATFEGGGHTSGDVPAPIVGYAGYEMRLPPSGTLAKTGCTFTGWSDGAAVYQPGDKYTFGAADVTFTAQWKEKVWTIEECLNTDNLHFTTGGDLKWECEFVETYDGVAGMKSGAVGDNQSSWLETSFVGTGKLTFHWKAEGEVNRGRLYDYVKCEIDGDVVAKAGVEPWTRVECAIETAGNHTVRWTWLKDSSGSSEQDCAWLDVVSWTPDAPAPVPPGGEIDVPKGKTAKEFADEVNKNKAQYLNWPLEGPVSTDYLGYFTAVPKGDAKVEFVLNEEGTNQVVEATTAAKTNTLESVLSKTGTLVIGDPLIGFYYSLKQGSDVTVGDKADLNKLAGRDELEFPLTTDKPKYFYQSLVTPTPVPEE